MRAESYYMKRWEKLDLLSLEFFIFSLALKKKLFECVRVCVSLIQEDQDAGQHFMTSCYFSNLENPILTQLQGLFGLKSRSNLEVFP